MRTPVVSGRKTLIWMLLTLLLGGTLHAIDVPVSIDFDLENREAGSLIESVNGTNDGTALVGPIGVRGTRPGDARNAAVLHHSTLSSGPASDLGTPNQAFGGVGVGVGGTLGAAYANQSDLGRILVIADNLVDANGDGLIDQTNDSSLQQLEFEFDFRTITAPFVPHDIRVLSLKVIDTEGPSPGSIQIFDALGNLISATPIVTTGNNGVATQWLGTPGLGVAGAATMKVILNGSAAIDDIDFEMSSAPPPSCDISSPGADHVHVEVGELLSFNLSAMSHEDDLLVEALLMPTGSSSTPGLPAGTTEEDLELEFTVNWTPTADQIGDHEFLFQSSDSLGQSSTCGVLVTVYCNLSIPPFGQPLSKTICEGESVYLSASPLVTQPATYQWQKDGVSIPGANTTNLTLTALGTGDAGDYTLVITNPCGTLTSQAATVTVKSPPSIDQHPSDVTTCEGTDATFSVVASGTSSLYYQWKKDGSSISGANSSTLTLYAVDSSDAGSYSVTVTNDCGHATSYPAQLTVRHPPSISSSPESRTHCVGESTTFHVSAYGSDPLFYQWKKDGNSISGANSSSYTISSVSTSDAGSYTVTVTNDCGSATSYGADLTVRTPPSIDSHPSDQTLCEGQAIQLTVSASGSYSLHYQWKKDGTPIYGATSSTLTIINATASDSGLYTVKVSNDCGNETSYGATVEVRVAPEITTHPMDQTLCEGETLTLTGAASGSHPLHYQWKRNGSPIPGANSATYTVSSAQASDSGYYTLHVSNDCGDAQSYAADVEVRIAPTITDHPSSKTLCEGQMLTLTASASGSEPLHYQWRKNGADLPGENSPNLMIMAVATSDAGSYTLHVSNDCGTAESSAAVVVVRVAPTITSQPTGQTLCEGESLLLSISATGSEPLHYQWHLDGAPIPGATSSTYMVSSVTTADDGVYTASVTNDCGSETSAPADVVIRVAPTISQDPVGGLLCEGDTLTLSVTAEGSAPLTYQWARDGLPLDASANPSAATALLIIPNTLASDSGTYTVTVTNNCGSATSAGASVTVRTAPEITTQPMDQILCEGETINLMVVSSGTAPLSYQWWKDGAPISGATSAMLSIPGALAADSGSYFVVVTNVCGTDTSAAAEVTVRVAPTITTQPLDQTLCLDDALVLTAAAAGTLPISYQWAKDGADLPGETASTLTITSVTVADAGVYTVTATNACGSATSNPATVVVREPPTITSDPTNQSICLGETATFSVTATGTPPLEYQWRKNSVELPGETASTIVITSVAVSDGGVYDCVVTNMCGTETSRGASLNVLLPPTITAQPQGADLCLGDDYTLAVTATGTDPLSYQWRKNGADIPGATGSQLVLLDVDTTDSGSYTVLVSNLCGDAVSMAAILNVRTPRTITSQPVGGTICLGDSLSLSVAVDGTGPISYQWALDGVPIPGATSSTYSVAAVDLADAGNYTVMATNVCGTVTSMPATVVVAEPPTITLDSPTAVTLCTGESTTLSATVTGFDPINLTWTLNGVPIPGAGASSFTITNATPADAGTYQLLADNLCGTDQSPPIEITVRVPPTITSQPTGDDETCPDEGIDFTFTVGATGSGPLSYQWFFNGAPISGANSSSYTIFNVVEDDYGAYTVEVSNDCGSVTSQTALLEDPAFGICETPFERGDCNADGHMDMADGIYIMRFSFQGFAPPGCLDACDHNDDGLVDVADSIWALTYIFLGGNAPLAPFGACGFDETLDEVDCEFFPPCETAP